MTARGEEDEPWEDLFNGKDFKGWKDAKHARFAKGEAVIAVPPPRPSKSPRNNQIGPAELRRQAGKPNLHHASPGAV